MTPPVQLFAYLARSTVPTVERWNEAIAAPDFPVELALDNSGSTISSEGVYLCRLKGKEKEAGVDYCSFDVPQALRASIELPSNTDFGIAFSVWRLEEYAAALAISSALSGGRLDASAGKYSGSNAVEWARNEFAGVLNDLE